MTRREYTSAYAALSPSELAIMLGQGGIPSRCVSAERLAVAQALVRTGGYAPEVAQEHAPSKALDQLRVDCLRYSLLPAGGKRAA